MKILNEGFKIVDLASTKACYGLFFLHTFLEMKEKNQGHHKLFFLMLEANKNNSRIIV
jgi:hypothetical protein